MNQRPEAPTRAPSCEAVRGAQLLTQLPQLNVLLLRTASTLYRDTCDTLHAGYMLQLPLCGAYLFSGAAGYLINN